MGRPGLTKHRKFLRLAQTVGGKIIARGALELLWDVAYENGDDFLGDALDVEAAADWRGEPRALVRALLDAGGPGGAGFIDEDPERPGCYRVHDLDDHSPDYVQKRLKRELARRARGVTIRDLRVAAGKKGAEAKKAAREASGGQLPASDQQTADGGSHLPSKRLANGVTPAPAPLENTHTAGAHAREPELDPNPDPEIPRYEYEEASQEESALQLFADAWLAACGYAPDLGSDLERARRMVEDQAAKMGKPPGAYLPALLVAAEQMAAACWDAEMSWSPRPDMLVRHFASVVKWETGNHPKQRSGSGTDGRRAAGGTRRGVSEPAGPKASAGGGSSHPSNDGGATADRLAARRRAQEQGNPTAIGDVIPDALRQLGARLERKPDPVVVLADLPPPDAA